MIYKAPIFVMTTYGHESVFTSYRKLLYIFECPLICSIKGALSRQRQFLATETPLKMMKIVFLFHLKSSSRSQDI